MIITPALQKNKKNIADKAGKNTGTKAPVDDLGAKT